ncbi:hypothetical protein U14_05410 [Candidatus Moduliflexus flocculans]|uniref:Linalool dehydratase/isomerase domain-containing protein n=1 Tax=Candidatus Moduliflexus flocculans TaxID=1499966 RepID=A0A081BRV1_9BACT|nr:hypothetical protein U14_05410 [Candidatus Moduliflexus flocculans]
MKSRLLLNLFAVALAAAVWLPCLHFFFRPKFADFWQENGVPPIARQLAARHLAIWTDPQLRQQELAQMQQHNPEWDFMSRTYFVLALANMALRDDTYRASALEIIEAIIENTLTVERDTGFQAFLLDYGKSGGWKMQPPRSIFIDGEIALMIAARRMIAERADYQPLLAERVAIMIERMKLSPVLSAESYPDECWIFCNTVALAAIRLSDVLDGTDHRAFLRDWIVTAKRRLSEPQSGLLISTYAVDGMPLSAGPGPEGTSIWMACNMLQVVNAEFAADQYRRARNELGRSFLGFGYSREWPQTSEGAMDIDSGPIVPIFEASASASGLAFLGAAGFRDVEYLTQLMTSLNFAGFPLKRGDALQYQTSNPVGDAVLLYALVQGPLWEKAK